jgi:phage terminase small subunit
MSKPKLLKRKDATYLNKTSDFLKVGDMLDEKQRLFIDEYIIDLNGYRSFKKVYYDDELKQIPNQNYINASVAKLLKNEKIRLAIKTALQEKHARLKVSQDKVLEKVCSIAFSNLKHLYDPTTGKMKCICDLPDDVAYAISSVKFDKFGNVSEIKLIDKYKALYDLAVYIGLFENGDKKTDPKEIANQIKDSLIEMRKLTLGDAYEAVIPAIANTEEIPDS